MTILVSLAEKPVLPSWLTVYTAPMKKSHFSTSEAYLLLIVHSPTPIFPQALHMGGGAFWGKTGSFLEDYEFDAVILSDEQLPCPHSLTPLERLERLIYLGDDRCITGKYVSGNKIF